MLEIFIESAGLETARALTDERLAEMAGVDLEAVKAWRAGLTVEPVVEPAAEPAPAPKAEPKKGKKAGKAPATVEAAELPAGVPVDLRVTTGTAMLRVPGGLLWRVLLVACMDPSGFAKGAIAQPALDELPEVLEAVGVPYGEIEHGPYREDALVAIRRHLWTSQPQLIKLREAMEGGRAGAETLAELAEAAGITVPRSVVREGRVAVLGVLADYAYGRGEKNPLALPAAPAPIKAQAIVAPAAPVAVAPAGELAKNVRVRSSFFCRGADGRHASYNLGDVFGGDVAIWLQVHHPDRVEAYPRKR